MIAYPYLQAINYFYLKELTADLMLSNAKYYYLHIVQI